MENLRWTKCKVLSRKKVAGSSSWRIHGTPPRGQRTQASWCYEIEDRPTWVLNVLLASPKNKKLESAWIPGPKKQVLREADSITPETTRGRVAERTFGNFFPQRDRSRSPKEKDKPPKTEEVAPTVMDTQEGSQPSQPENNQGAAQSCRPAAEVAQASKPSEPTCPEQALNSFHWTQEDHGGERRLLLQKRRG